MEGMRTNHRIEGTASLPRALARSIDARIQMSADELPERELRRLVIDSVLDPRLGLLSESMHLLRSRLSFSPGQAALEEARDAMEDRLRLAVVGSPSVAPIYDIERAHAVSSVGWARQLLRGLARHTRLRSTPASLDTIVEHEPAGLVVAEPAYISDQQLDVLQEAERFMANRRMPQRLFLGRSFIQRAFDIPSLALPEHREQRDDTLEVLKTLGPDAATELRAAMQNSGHTLSALFADWDTEDRQRFADRGDELMVTYLVASLSPRPKPPEHVIAQVKRTVRSASTRTGWPTVAVHLVRSWLAEYFSALTDFDGRSDPEAAEERRIGEAENWPVVAEQALSFPGTPLSGQVPADIDKVLSEILAEISPNDGQ